MTLKFCANISMLFGEMPLEQRIGAARNAGFKAVEILFPYDANCNDIRQMLDKNGMPLALINCPPPNYTGGPRGFAAIPGLEARFERDLARVMRHANLLRPHHIHIMAGAPTQGCDQAAAHTTFIENLRHATLKAPDQSFTIEPINKDDMPGYFLSNFDDALDILAEVGADNLGLQFDAYHAHKITEDVMGTWEKCRHKIRHIQFADAPGRHEPGSGEIDLGRFFEAVDESEYTGWLSAEYVPQKLTEHGLGWLAAQSS